MELELGLKITKVVDDVGSTNLLISKNRGGALFLCSETDTMFILTAHLNGYRKENVKVDINEDGTKITIRGEKPVQEMVMVGWKVVTNDIDIRGFRKSFKIPDGIILDKIKAIFNDDASLLTILIPKTEKGVVRGKGLEELENEEVLGVDSQPSNVNEEKMSIQENQDSGFEELEENGNGEAREEEFDGNGKRQGKKELVEENKCDKEDDEEEEQKSSIQENHKSGLKEEDKGYDKEVIEHTESKKAPFVEEKKAIDENQKDKDEGDAENSAENEHKCDCNDDKAKETSMQENQEPKIKEVMENRSKDVIGKENSEKCSVVQDSGLIEEEEKNVIENASESDDQIENIATTSHVSQTVDQDKAHKDDKPREKSKVCVPIIAGSALVLSFIVLAFHFIRSKNQTSRRRD